jgi:hypothetical protein
MSNMLSFRAVRRLLVAALMLGGAVTGAVAEAQDEELTVTEVQLANQVEAGVAVSPTTTFARDSGRVFAVVRLENPSRTATRVVVSFEPVEGTSRSRGLTLDVPAQPRYRTVARFSPNRAPGRYRCVVRTESGRELASVEVTITG